MRAADSLSRRIALPLGLAFLLAALVLLGLGWSIGRRALATEHEASSMRMAALFEASLRRSMLERNLDGLQELLVHLGGMPGLRGAALLNPQGEVRFDSGRGRVGRQEGAALAGMCLQTGCGPVSPPRLHWHPDGAEGSLALRVAWPVQNEARCARCHGEPKLKPVNGVLLLDFAPMASAQQASRGIATALLPAALATLAALGGAVAWVLRRRVLRPVETLADQACRLGDGDLAARSALPGDDELARLGQAFDAMAGRLQHQIDDLAAQRIWLQAVLDAAPDPVLMIGADHRITLANVAYGRLIGRRLSDIVGQPCHRLSRGLDEPCAATLVRCPLVELQRDGEAARTVMAFQGAEGQPVTVEVHAAALRAPDGARQVVEVIRPLDEQVRFSQEQRLSAIGLLAHGVAHEIHNPLASIRLALQSLARQLEEPVLDRAELADYLGLVDGQIDRCVAITRRLLSLSEPASQPSRPVDVGAAVADVTALLAEEARQQRVRLDADVPAGLQLAGDPGELRQVLLNLMQNALHAQPEGGAVRVRASRAVAADGAATVRLTVEDEGPGIPADVLPLVFLPFYSRRADGRRGTGMGLAICKSLVEQRGGRIAAGAATGGGARLTVELPEAPV